MRTMKSVVRWALTGLLLAGALPSYAQFNFPALTIRNGTADPATCQPHSRNVFINRVSTPVLKLCSAEDTWVSVMTTAGGTFTGDLTVGGTSTLTGSVGIGGAPSGTAGLKVYVQDTADNNTIIRVSNTNAVGTAAAGVLSAVGSTALMSMIAHGDGRTTSRWGEAVGGWAEILASAGDGMAIGTIFSAPLKIGTASTVVEQISSSQVMTWPLQALTAGTMTAGTEASPRTVTTCRTWTNAMVAALAGTAGDIAFGTLPAKTKVRDATVVITGAAVGPATVTVALGRTSAAYIDYIVASDAKVAANTVYGDVSGERGTNLTGYDLPSYTGTTVVNAHFISTGADLSTVTGSTGTVCMTTEKLP